MTTTTTDQPDALVFQEQFDAICRNVEQIVRGKPATIRLAVTCLIAGGHLLLEDVPGVGKTALAKAIARSVDGEFGRVQFTPDLLPADVLGTSVWNQNTGSFEFRHGPVFSHLLLADEINRASPKTQSALLEAMAEEHATVDGTTYPLPRPFMVIATQNPLEHHGTYPLPESQLDRFLMKLTIGYPGQEAEMELLLDDTRDDALSELRPVAAAEDVLELSRVARSVHVSDPMAAYLVHLADNSRTSGQLTLGVSTRAILGLLRASKVKAASEGRDFVIPDDAKHLAVDVLSHRVAVSPNSRLEGLDGAAAIRTLLDSTPVPG